MCVFTQLEKEKQQKLTDKEKKAKQKEELNLLFRPVQQVPKGWITFNINAFKEQPEVPEYFAHWNICRHQTFFFSLNLCHH